MASSGTIWGSFSGLSTSIARPYINWGISQNNATTPATSTVTAALIFVKYNAANWAYNSSFSNTNNINGSENIVNSSFDTRPSTTANVYVEVESRTLTVNHNADGTKSCYIGWSGNTGTTYGTFSFGATVTFNTITRNASISTSAASSINHQQATVGGNVTDVGIPAYSDRGVYWGYSSGSTPYQISYGGSGAGAFSFAWGSLSPNTTYYYKAYAYNASYGTLYGSVVNFTTSAVAPTLTTSAVSSVYSNKATGNGNITNIYGASATRRGFCYMTGTSGDPTTSDSVAYDDGTFGTGTFSKVLTGLSPSTNYRVRPYAVNSAGTGYGTTVQLTTLTDEHTLELSDTMALADSFSPRKALKMAGVLLSGVYGGWYVGANYWAGGFTRNFIEEFVDSLKVNDTMSKIVGYVKGLVESLSIVDTFTSGFARAVYFLESITVKSGLERLYSMVRGWVESLSITDTFAKFVANVREFAESISLTEAFNASMVYIKGLVDSIVASDLYTNSVGKVLQSVVTITDTASNTIALVREFVESVVLQEVFNTVRLFLKVFEDSISLADSILQATGRYFIDTINVIDNWWKAFVITLTDIISIEDVLSGFTKTYKRVVQEIISLSDLVSKNATIVLASIVKILDGEFTRKLNGQLIAWGKGIRKVLEWAKVVKKEDEYLTIERKLNDWEVREKDLGLYESKVKPLDEWTKLRKKQ